MLRAGREPAEDVKRRLIAASEEVGLSVVNASMHLIKDAGVRVVYVGASVAGWAHAEPTLSVMANVKVSGDWPEFVDLRCVGSDKDPVTITGPWMKGRSKVPFPNLIEELIETLKERKQVMASVNSGIECPYKFERSVWDYVNPLRGLKLP